MGTTPEATDDVATAATATAGLYRHLPPRVLLADVTTAQDTSLSWYPERLWLVAADGAAGGLAAGGCDGDGD
jgi:hypothetical protein